MIGGLITNFKILSAELNIIKTQTGMEKGNMANTLKRKSGNKQRCRKMKKCL